MIFFDTEKRPRVFGMVFQLQKKDKCVDCNLSTRETVDGTTEYSQWSTRFVGQAFTKATELSDKDTIELTKFKITTKVVNNVKYTNIVVFDFKTPAELEAEKLATANTDPNS